MNVFLVSPATQAKLTRCRDLVPRALLPGFEKAPWGRGWPDVDSCMETKNNLICEFIKGPLPALSIGDFILGSAMQASLTTILDKINGTLSATRSWWAPGPTPSSPSVPQIKDGKIAGFQGVLPYKSEGVLVVSLWGVNCRSWSHIGCLGWKSPYLPIQLSLRTVHKKMCKKCPDTDHTEISFGVSLTVSQTLSPRGLFWIFRRASPQLLYTRRLPLRVRFPFLRLGVILDFVGLVVFCDPFWIFQTTPSLNLCDPDF